jgi:hypothetical protein
VDVHLLLGHKGETQEKAENESAPGLHSLMNFAVRPWIFTK